MRPWRERLAVWSSGRALRRCSFVGARSLTDGEPFIANEGEIVLGDDVHVRSIPVQTHLATGPSGRLHIGSRTRIAHGVSICAYGAIDIGEGTTIGPFAVLLDVDFHAVHDRRSMGEPRPISIGRHVRIGAGAVILRGAILGDGVEVAPHCTVARRVPDGMRVAGVPARPIGAVRTATVVSISP